MQLIAKELLRSDLAEARALIAQQCLVEFVAGTTRPLRENGGRQLLDPVEAAYEAEDLCRQFTVLHPKRDQSVSLSTPAGLFTGPRVPRTTNPASWDL
ncbi:MAG: hypothetical protein R6V45_07730 [Oceanipulchritudo sp.]